MPRQKDRKNLRLVRVLKLKLSLKMVAVFAVAIFSFAAGVFFYINFFNSSTSKATEVAHPSSQLKQVDFTVKELKTDFQEYKINGVKVRKAVDLSL